MKIAFVCGFAWEPKGTVRARAFPLAVELVQRGHKVTIFTVPYDNPRYSGSEETRNGVPIVNVKVSNASIFNMGFATLRLLQRVRQWNPDIVHFFKPKGFAGAAGELFLRIGNPPAVLDCDDWEGWGGWNDVSKYPWPVKQWIDWQERSLIKRTPVITVASQVLADRAYGFGKNSDQVFHLPNCTSKELLMLGEQFSRKDADIWKKELGLPSPPAILYVGHFDPLDDVWFFCKTVVSASVKHAATVVIVGDGPQLPEVKKFFAQKPEVHVHFTGALAFEDYLRVLAACDVVTFPYPNNGVYRAKCSARIIDFMAFGKAILSSAVGENSHYLVNGESGILVPPSDASAYESALDRLLLNVELRRQLGQNAHKRVASRFTWEKQVENCLRAYQRILNRPAAACSSVAGA